MIKFFQAHPEFVLISLAFLLLAILTVAFFWSITTLITFLNKGIGANANQVPAVGFDLKGARALDLKGSLRQ